MVWAKPDAVNACLLRYTVAAFDQTPIHTAAMTKTKLYLLLIASFSLMFIGLVGLGGHFWATANKGMALACFLLAFASVIGQMGSLALFLRARARARFIRQHHSK